MKDVTFKALVIRENESGKFTRSIELRSTADLPGGDVLVQVRYSSLNYKDALSASGNRAVTKKYPHTPGVDAAGVVAWSRDNRCTVGAEVLVCGFDLGMNTSGGFGQFISVPADWVIPRPAGLTFENAMRLGTAGFTAAQCVSALIESGCYPAGSAVLVTGATGGVGSVAVDLLAHLGFTVTAVTGKDTEHDFLRKLGVEDILNRQQAMVGSDRLLLRERWQGVVDTVGGDMLATAIKSTCYGGTVTCCGNAASGDLPLNVYPFILRGIKLVGIDSAECPLARRKQIWDQLAGEWQIPHLEEMSTIISLNELDGYIAKMLQGGVKGRIVIDLREDVCH